MNTPYITAILAVTSLEFSAGAMGIELSQSEYRAAGKQIEAECKSARTICDFLAPNAKGIFMAEARRTEKIARSKLEARHKHARMVNYEISITKA